MLYEVAVMRDIRHDLETEETVEEGKVVKKIEKVEKEECVGRTEIVADSREILHMLIGQWAVEKKIDLEDKNIRVMTRPFVN